MATTNDSSKLVYEVKQAGTRAVKVVERAAGTGPWTKEAILCAATWLETGAKEGGVTRAWPKLAARLRNLVERDARPAKPHATAVTTTPMARATKLKAAKIATKPSDLGIASENALTTTPTDPGALPFSEFAEKYLRHLEHEGKSRGTVFSYSLDLKVAVRHFGETRNVKSVTTDEVAAYFECDAVTKYRAGGTKNPITVKKIRRTLRLALVWGAKAGFLWTAPVATSEKSPDDAASSASATEENVIPTTPSAS